jgi:hypothetical protein
MYPKTPLAFVLHVMKPFRKWIACVGLTCLFIAIDLAFRPYLTKIIIDRLQNANSDNIYHLLITPITNIHWFIGNGSAYLAIYGLCLAKFKPWT